MQTSCVDAINLLEKFHKKYLSEQTRASCESEFISLYSWNAQETYKIGMNWLCATENLILRKNHFWCKIIPSEFPLKVFHSQRFKFTTNFTINLIVRCIFCQWGWNVKVKHNLSMTLIPPLKFSITARATSYFSVESCRQFPVSPFCIFQSKINFFFNIVSSYHKSNKADAVWFRQFFLINFMKQKSDEGEINSKRKKNFSINDVHTTLKGSGVISFDR